MIFTYASIMDYGTRTHVNTHSDAYDALKYQERRLFTHHGDERSPLIIRRRRRRRHFEPIINWKVMILILLFLSGLFIGIYLLFEEYNADKYNFAYDLIELETWYQGGDLNSANITNVVPLTLPVTNIIISHTKTDDCYAFKSCQLVINNMIENDPLDIAFNFLISSYGHSYESARSWKYLHGLQNNINDSIAIGFIGDFSYNEPSANHLAELEALINDAIRRHMLKKDFQIFGIQSDGDIKLHKNLKQMKQWGGFL